VEGGEGEGRERGEGEGKGCPFCPTTFTILPPPMCATTESYTRKLLESSYGNIPSCS